MSDTGGYVAGVLFGKHPMAPKISPKKSWEGFAGSMVFGLVAGVWMAVFGLTSPFWVGLILGVCLVAIGTCGDLIESMIKRDLGHQGHELVPARSRRSDGSSRFASGRRPGSLVDHVPLGPLRVTPNQSLISGPNRAPFHIYFTAP